MKNYRQHIKTLETGNARSMVVTSWFAGFPFLNGGFMLAEITALFGSITLNIPVTPNFFNFLSNLQKDLTTFTDITIGIRLAVYQVIDFVISVTSSSKKEENAAQKAPGKSSGKINIDDPIVLSSNIFAQGLKNKNESNYESALSVFERYRTYHPENPNVYFEMADCNLALDLNEKAMALVDRAISLNPEYGEAIGLKGCMLIINKEYQAALYYLHIGNTLAPNTDYILYALYLIYTEIGLTNSAMVCLQQLIANDPFEMAYQIDQAVLYQSLGQLNKAIGVMHRVVSRYPDETSYIEYLNDLKHIQGGNVSCYYEGMNN